MNTTSNKPKITTKCSFFKRKYKQEYKTQTKMLYYFNRFSGEKRPNSILNYIYKTQIVYDPGTVIL